ncbi:MAG: HPr family phosphocarrier protein [Eubacteriales bacterium]
MVSKKVTVCNPSGIHARPAGVLVKTTGKCNSDVFIVVGDKKIVAKSILNIMAAAIKCGTEIEIQCEGKTEVEDLEAVVAVIEGGLGE